MLNPPKSNSLHLPEGQGPKRKVFSCAPCLSGAMISFPGLYHHIDNVKTYYRDDRIQIQIMGFTPTGGGFHSFFLLHVFS